MSSRRRQSSAVRDRMAAQAWRSLERGQWRPARQIAQWLRGEKHADAPEIEGRALAGLRQWDAAIAAVRGRRRGALPEWRARLLAGLWLSAAGRTDEARRELELALRTPAADRSALLLELGRIEAAAGNTDAALAHFDAVSGEAWFFSAMAAKLDVLAAAERGADALWLADKLAPECTRRFAERPFWRVDPELGRAGAMLADLQGNASPHTALALARGALAANADAPEAQQAFASLASLDSSQPVFAFVGEGAWPQPGDPSAPLGLRREDPLRAASPAEAIAAIRSFEPGPLQAAIELTLIPNARDPQPSAPPISIRSHWKYADEDDGAELALPPSADELARQGEAWHPLRFPGWFPTGLVAATLVAIAAALRFKWLNYGLPDVVYVDAFKFVDVAREMAASMDFRPREFQYPALYSHLLALLYLLFRIETPLALHLTARAVSAVAGTALAWVVWRASRPALSQPAALLAAALTAVSIEFVSLSRETVSDVILALFMTASFGCAVAASAAPRPRPLHIATAGIAMGLAVATKWTGLYLLIFSPVLIAFDLARRSRPLATLRGASAIFLLAIMAFFAVNPHFPRFYSEYRDRFLIEAKIQEFGKIGGVQEGWLDYWISATPAWEAPWLGASLLGNMDGCLFAATLIGLAAALGLRRRPALVLHALFALIYIALISGPGRLKAARFLAPVLPSLYIVAAGGLDAVLAALDRRWRWLAFALLSLVLLTPLVLRSVHLVEAAARPTTAQLAERWIRGSHPYEPGFFVTPFFLDNLASLPRTPLFMTGAGSRQYRLPGDPSGNANLSPIYYPALLDALRAEGASYVVTNSWFDNGFSPVPENRRFFPQAVAAYAAWRARLARESQVVYSIKGWSEGRLGPDIEVRKLTGEATAP